MFTSAFWLATLERATKTFAQTATALWAGGDAVFNIVDIDIAAVLGVSASAAVVSGLTSLASIPLSAGNSPSLVPAAEVEAAGQ